MSNIKPGGLVRLMLCQGAVTIALSTLTKVATAKKEMGGEGDKGLSHIVDQGEKTLTMRCRGDMSHSCPRLALVQLYSVPVPRCTSTLDTQLSRQLVTRGLPPTKNLFGFANIDVCMWKKAVNIQLVDLFASHLGKTWCYVMSKFIHNTFMWNNSHEPKQLHVSPVHGNIRIVLLDDSLLTWSRVQILQTCAYQFTHDLLKIPRWTLPQINSLGSHVSTGSTGCFSH